SLQQHVRQSFGMGRLRDNVRARQDPVDIVAEPGQLESVGDPTRANLLFELRSLRTIADENKAGEWSRRQHLLRRQYQLIEALLWTEAPDRQDDRIGRIDEEIP